VLVVAVAVCLVGAFVVFLAIGRAVCHFAGMPAYYAWAWPATFIAASFAKATK
jgi:hypothetical protein